MGGRWYDIHRYVLVSSTDSLFIFSHTPMYSPRESLWYSANHVVDSLMNLFQMTMMDRHRLSVSQQLHLLLSEDTLWGQVSLAPLYATVETK